jgi:hypothetical protein
MLKSSYFGKKIWLYTKFHFIALFTHLFLDLI